MSAITPAIRHEDFDLLYDHLSTVRNGKYKNMHMRKPKKSKNGGGNVLKYLHIIRIKDLSTLEGALSGPGIEAEYEIKRLTKVASIKYFNLVATDREKKRILQRLMREILKRATDEKNYSDNAFPPPWKAGQFYLKRGIPGTCITRPNCQLALASGVLSRSFLEKLEEWSFRLVYPKNSD